MSDEQQPRPLPRPGSTLAEAKAAAAAAWDRRAHAHAAAMSKAIARLRALAADTDGAFAAVAEAHAAPPERTAAVALGRHRLALLDEIARDVEALALLDLGATRLEPSVVDVCDQVRSAVAAARARGHAERLTVDVVGDARRRMSVDPEKLQSILKALIAAGEPGPASLIVRVAADGITFAVTPMDDGATDPERATTLENRLAEGFVGLLGGSASFPPEGGGIVFMPDRLFGDAPGEGAAWTVLVVDDHPTNQRLLRVVFEQLGHTVVLADDGVLAEQAARSSDFDLVLMDLHMPRMDGFEATRRIRRLPGRRGHTPIVVLTADCRTEARTAALEAGADGYIQKPIEVAPLVALADALVRNFRAEQRGITPARRRRAA